MGWGSWSEIGFGGHQLRRSRICGRRGKSELPEAEMTIPYSPLEPPLSWSHQQLTFPSQVSNRQIYLVFTKYHLKISPETEREIKTFVGKLNFIGSIAAASVSFQIS